MPASWWQSFAAAAEALPAPAQAASMLDLARIIATRGDKRDAASHAYRAIRLAERNDDPATARRARRFLAGLVPRYHAQVATDPTRAAAWDAALRSGIGAGTTALEIGTGCGILAMMAARAGAKVIACEQDPVLAAIAEEMVRVNGLSDAIRILAKPAETLAIPRDLAVPADLLFLDVFADNLFNFRPFALLRAVRPLLAPDVRAIPARVALMGALAYSTYWARQMPGEVAGFDLRPLRAAGLGEVSSDPDRPVMLRSAVTTCISATLPDALPPDQGEALHDFVSDGGPVNGLALWLRLELAPGLVLEAHPETRPPGFYARPLFHAFDTELDLRAGERLAARVCWEDGRVYAALDRREVE
jgi:type II protein arginine methyltransferase